MSTPEVFITDEAVERLVNVGMPRAAAEVVQATKGFSPRMTMLTGLITLVILMGLIFGSVYLQAVCPLSKLFVAFGLVSADTLLIDVERIYPVCLVFGAIAATGVLSNGIALLNKQLATRSAITSLQKYVQRNSDASLRVFPGWLLKRIDPDLHPADYLAAYPRAEFWLALRITTVIVLLTCVCFVWDGLSATCMTSDGVHLGNHFRWSRVVVSWEQVEEVSTGCYCSGNGTVRNLRYVLHCPGAESAEFSNAVSVVDDERPFDSLGELDQVVRTHQIPWRRATFPGGPFEGQAQWDPRCFEMVREELSDDDWKRFRKIFRIGARAVDRMFQ